MTRRNRLPRGWWLPYFVVAGFLIYVAAIWWLA